MTEITFYPKEGYPGTFEPAPEHRKIVMHVCHNHCCLTEDTIIDSEEVANLHGLTFSIDQS